MAVLRKRRVNDVDGNEEAKNEQATLDFGLNEENKASDVSEKENSESTEESAAEPAKIVVKRKRIVKKVEKREN